MKNRLLRSPLALIFLYLLLGQGLQAQDLIILQDGQEITTKVLEIDPPKVYYQDHPDGPIRNRSTQDIFMIKYANGDKETFALQNKKTRNHRPFSIGISPGIGLVDDWLNYSFSASFGYEIPLSKNALRFVGDAYILTPELEDIGYFSTYTFNLSTQYIFQFAEKKLEVFVEGGMGTYYEGRNDFDCLLHAGVGLEYRFSDLISLYLHPRVQVPLLEVAPSALLTANAGLRFRFGKS